MKMYKASFGTIEIVDVEKATDISVWIRGMVNMRVIEYQGYFESFELAKDFLLGIAKSKLNSAKSTLDYAEKEYEKVRSLTEKATT